MSGWGKQCGAEARRIAEQVLERYGLTLTDVRPIETGRKYSRPRRHAMAVLIDTGRYSYPAVGRLFNRDHSTVHAGVRAHRQRGDQ